MPASTARVLFIIACICFTLAALEEAAVVTGQQPLAWVFGGLAAVALAWAAG
jgi:hypothetical protein